MKKIWVCFAALSLAFLSPLSAWAQREGGRMTGASFSIQRVIPEAGTGSKVSGYWDPPMLGDRSWIDYTLRGKNLGRTQNSPASLRPFSRSPVSAANPSGRLGSKPLEVQIPRASRDAVGSRTPVGFGVPAVRAQEPKPNRSMLSHLKSPLLLPSVLVPQADPESARTLAGHDYQQHLLGVIEKAPPIRPEPGSLQNTESVPIRLELEAPLDAGSLSSLLFRLEQNSGFSATSRNSVFRTREGKVFVQGRISPQQLVVLLRDPAVRSVQEEYAQNHFAIDSSSVKTNMNISIHLGEEAGVGFTESLQATLLELEKNTGFRAHLVTEKIKRNLGGWVVRVSGDIPLSRVSALMRRPGVTYWESVLPQERKSMPTLQNPEPSSAEKRFTEWFLKGCLRMVFGRLSSWVTRVLQQNISLASWASSEESSRSLSTAVAAFGLQPQEVSPTPS
ncbi:MAG: hypothetical protein HY399_02430 [Elusimicrobia bacterium]|nr:hypothetical protein [Elusimicrobiota bacterium]